MDASIATQKRQLRQEIRSRLLSISSLEMKHASEQVCMRVREHDLWKAAKSVLFYAPLKDEVDVWPLFADALDKGKLSGLPRYVSSTDSYQACQISGLDSGFRLGRFEVREPHEDCPVVPWGKFELILVPGLAFDAQGHRLGRGKGYYDRLLALTPGKKCGVGFDPQILIAIPSEPHDIILDCVVTPTRWLTGSAEVRA